MKRYTGQIAISTLVGATLISSIVGAIGTSFVTNTINSPAQSASAISTIDTRIAVLEKSDQNQDVTIKEMKDNVEYIRRAIEALTKDRGLNIK